MRLKLGRVRYINCEPVYYALEHGLVHADCEIHDGTPAELNERLRTRDLDVSVISAMEAALRPQAYRLLPGLAIACDGAVESVLLASERPVEELNALPVALSRHSLTSSRRPFCPTVGWAASEPWKVPVPARRKLHSL